ncbi:Integral membrane protein [Streptococcus parasanguinis FW213]|uniref:Integral membrane protein n=2 Tax=Streptococcus TaxID=1301 RepID=I1ZJC0_STRPA|nr:Integral membrane protein [Streptococcus parasanguinis FW213]
MYQILPALSRTYVIIKSTTMKRVSSMNLKLIRLRARTMQVQQPGLAILFALPVLLTILANFLLSGQDLIDLLPDMTLQQAGIYMIQRQLFPSVVSFVISILVVGATFSYLDTINPKIEHRTRVLDIFKQDRFTSVFATLILKQVVLFLWGLILYVGSLISTYASIRFLAIYDKVSNPSTLSASSPEFQSLMQQMPLMTTGVVLGLLGLLFYLPQYYSLSLVELILYEQLRDGDYKGAFGVLRQSRETMKGFRSNRLVLDLTLIGWYFLNYFTRDVIGFYTMPYFINCQIAFYDQIKQIKQGPRHFTGHPSHETE